MQNVVEITPKIAKIRDFRRFSCIGLSAGFAEYSAEHYRPKLAEYWAEYSVFGRTLIQKFKNGMMIW